MGKEVADRDIREGLFGVLPSGLSSSIYLLGIENVIKKWAVVAHFVKKYYFCVTKTCDYGLRKRVREICTGTYRCSG